MCALYYARAAGFEVIHGLLDRLMLMLGVKHRDDSSPAAAGDEAQAPKKKQPSRYFLEAYDGAFGLLIQASSCKQFISSYVGFYFI